MKKLVAYIASPLGFSEAGRLFYKTVFLPLIAEVGFVILDPWELTPARLINSVQNLPYGQEKKEQWSKINSIMGSNNRLAIEKSDIVIAVLDGTNVDEGTASEIGYGAALKKTIIGYRNDFRLSSENEGCKVNLQVEYFINFSGGKIVTDLESLKKALIDYKKRF